MRVFTKLILLAVGLLSAFSASATRFTVLVGAGGNNRFEPAVVSMKLGDDVEFKYVSGSHPTMSDSSPQTWSIFTLSAQMPSKIIPASDFKVGDYPYHCTAHEDMTGLIKVEGAALATAPPALANALTIFPNPSRSGLVSVTLNERLKGETKLRLRNIIGQEVRTIALRPELIGSAGLPLDLSDLPAGLYFYSLVVDNKAVLTKRLTLQ